MSRISFENYGRRARELQDPTQVAARYRIQKEGERRIVLDVAGKLALSPQDILLDLGCNIGNLLIPLSFLVNRVVGIDHPDCIRRLNERFCGSNVSLIAGNFLDVEVSDGFHKILCYDVLHYCSDAPELFAVMDKAVSLLEPGGRALFGDLPNSSSKQRFLQSRTGKEFVRVWEKQKLKDSHPDLDYDRSLPVDSETVQIDDTLVIGILARYRDRGFHTYVLPQPADLPFGNTREDVLIVRLE